MRATSVTLALFVCFSTILCASPGAAQTYSALYSFCAQPNCTDGASPLYAAPVRDPKGNLYGTTQLGGANAQGTVFEVMPANGEEAVLHNFSGYPKDGAYPQSGLVRDKQGNLYGTTQLGGVNHNYGTVFKVDPTGAEIILHSFVGPLGEDGAQPIGGLVLDAAGNLYGTTQRGGASDAGTVFELNTTGTTYAVLYNFTNVPDGEFPFGSLVRDSKGNLYGTTLNGGIFNAGTVFKLDTKGIETVLYSFTGGADGDLPYAGLLLNAGNLYGTTSGGGNTNFGTVFKLNIKTGKETVLYSFMGAPDGANPYAGLVRDKAGNLYGTTQFGGELNQGTVFEVNKTGGETVLRGFGGEPDGALPVGALLRDSAGSLFGFTQSGGTHGCCKGMVFELDP